MLTGQRWGTLKPICGQSPLLIYAIAWLGGRGVKVVHGDVQALTLAGVLDKTESGRAIFPYQAVQVDFMLNAA